MKYNDTVFTRIGAQVAILKRATEGRCYRRGIAPSNQNNSYVPKIRKLTTRISYRAQRCCGCHTEQTRYSAVVRVLKMLPMQKTKMKQMQQ